MRQEIQKSNKLTISVALCKPIKEIFVKGVQVTFEEYRKREEQGDEAGRKLNSKGEKEEAR